MKYKLSPFAPDVIKLSVFDIFKLFLGKTLKASGIFISMGYKP